jgi:hypothetical protein
MEQGLTLSHFIGQNREELISRCGAKVARRSVPYITRAEIDHGVPMFLDQLCDELVHGRSKTHDIAKSAEQNGHDLLLQRFTISQVVHGYGDVCQSVTDLALELGAPISTDDFRTLNRCLDDAIAGAVTQYASEQDLTRDGESSELRHLVDATLTAFEVIQTGSVGFSGSTGKLIGRNLKAMLALIDRHRAETVVGRIEAKP